ncbi:MAG: hypothetical protein M0Q14_08665 [Tissierellaceae bacterium]|nr:hypothetical protein [Tissierellaceae bacterium]
MGLFDAKKVEKRWIKSGQFTDEELPYASLIQQRRCQMLIHSRIYYVLDENLITDAQFDEWGRELVQLQKDYPDIASKVCFAKAFEDWDASTGAFLPLKDEWVIRKAAQLLNYGREKGVIDNIEHSKIQQSPRIQGSQKPARKKATKQRGNSLF